MSITNPYTSHPFEWLLLALRAAKALPFPIPSPSTQTLSHPLPLSTYATLFVTYFYFPVQILLWCCQVGGKPGWTKDEHKNQIPIACTLWTLGLKFYILSFFNLSPFYYLSGQKCAWKFFSMHTENCKVVPQGGKCWTSRKCTIDPQFKLLACMILIYFLTFPTWMFNILSFKSVCEILKTRDPMVKTFLNFWQGHARKYIWILNVLLFYNT